jgi:hypothetical protein
MVYFLVWWTVLFAVLPFGVQPDEAGARESGGWRGAPRRPAIVSKARVDHGGGHGGLARNLLSGDQRLAELPQWLAGDAYELSGVGGVRRQKSKNWTAFV